jgi:hypothetical protein
MLRYFLTQRLSRHSLVFAAFTVYSPIQLKHLPSTIVHTP